MSPSKLSLILGCLMLSTACGDDDDTPPIDAAPLPDQASLIDAGEDADAGPNAARGEYLVKAVLACSDCHTPRLKGGAPDLTKFLAGVDCFVDIDPGNPEVGCISSRNLTNDATGLKNRSDEEIKDFITKGERPDKGALHPIMPFYVFSQLTPYDLDSLVAYLRTLPAVEHTVAANQPPWTNRPAEPAPPLGNDEIPEPTVDNPATQRGKYLATLTCLECHTKRTDPTDSRSLDKTKLYGGGEPFPAAALGLPSPPFPELIYTRNLTPHPTAGLGYTKPQILKVLKDGVAKDDSGVCPPMPVGMAAYGNLTEGDASDIADYLLVLPPIDNGQIPDCQMPTGP